jgi:hypothetical protein
MPERTPAVTTDERGAVWPKAARRTPTSRPVRFTAAGTRASASMSIATSSLGKA